jgi:hypothetical protein
MHLPESYHKMQSVDYSSWHYKKGKSIDEVLPGFDAVQTRGKIRTSALEMETTRFTETLIFSLQP